MKLKVNDVVYVPSLGNDQPITRTRITELWASEDGPGYMVQGFGNAVFTEDMLDTTVTGLIEKHVVLHHHLVREEA